MIKAINISKHYIVQGKKKEVFRNLSLTIHPGERVALMGRNGAGKSTLLRILCGIEKPSSGVINITSSLSWPVGVTGGAVPNLTGRENVKFVCRLFMDDREQVKEKIDFVKEFSEIGDYFDMPVQTYSSGMRSRLAFALSMAFDFDFYIVDEALAVGDPAFKEKCRKIFSQKAANKGVIMVSHSVGLIRQFCNRGIFLHNNQVVKGDNINDIIKLYKGLRDDINQTNLGQTENSVEV
ncbi:ABC transporter ATP-binding protein [Legionella oakridgensis]|uniref:ABC-type polysaccharide/polyol phosphate transport system, ATPase component n=2 Tax=Legionella oakridgensis TaxID=29423 RepID=W0BB15_9GAMM|nr:ABC transporter ATP-binding protein [Legionella oakridgensis]AHE65619.1 ABC-type polysaccharide/polyol phosphate transport system, ATPase component [Legionella oakridgensis ATCC 33761 = DSM 21215]KTD38287.1 Capsule polysaccharide export ATP-binding protein ctrD (Capsular-polysaccharide-transporting ATPase) [Legionella oakridgensis]STY15581.1 Capsule polysaccharide export ATP-binding protein ctrD (Capsular-polysaccharide-transporting ATPase) [Legionella longbeachae]